MPKFIYNTKYHTTKLCYNSSNRDLSSMHLITLEPKDTYQCSQALYGTGYLPMLSSLILDRIPTNALKPYIGQDTYQCSQALYWTGYLPMLSGLILDRIPTNALRPYIGQDTYQCSQALYWTGYLPMLSSLILDRIPTNALRPYIGQDCNRFPQIKVKMFNKI